MTCKRRALICAVFLLQHVVPVVGKPVLQGNDITWASWASWSTCTVTCATGTQSRSRTCLGAGCIGDSQDTKDCNTQKCPIDGMWASWGSWSKCTVTCATGTQSRSRTCSNPTLQNGGDYCSGDRQETQNCNTQNCPIDGDWTRWSSWSACGVTCSDTPVIRSRERSCTNPEPQFNGADCNGDTAETETCDLNPCPIDGNWGAWQDWSGCLANCGTGTRRRFRVCDSPAPARMGEQCQGEQDVEQSCSVLCPVSDNNNMRFLNTLFLLGVVLTVTGMYGTGYDVGSGGYGYGGLGVGVGGGSGGSSMSGGFGGILKLVMYVMVFVMIINLLGSSSGGLGDGGS